VDSIVRIPSDYGDRDGLYQVLRKIAQRRTSRPSIHK